MSPDMDEDLEEYLGINDHVTFIDGEPIIFTRYENDSDEPRIGGYPDTIIRSADEMFKAMQTGLTNWENKHFHFRFEDGDTHRDSVEERFSERVCQSVFVCLLLQLCYCLLVTECRSY